jgi:hypothetical protein
VGIFPTYNRCNEIVASEASMNRIPVQALLALQAAERRQTAARPTSRAARPQAAVLRRLGVVLTVLTGVSAAVAMTQTAT